jgi:hypothetical protein
MSISVVGLRYISPNNSNTAIILERFLDNGWTCAYERTMHCYTAFCVIVY